MLHRPKSIHPSRPKKVSFPTSHQHENEQSKQKIFQRMSSEPARNVRANFLSSLALIHFNIDRSLICIDLAELCWRNAEVGERSASTTHVGGVIDVESLENVITSDHYAATLTSFHELDSKNLTKIASQIAQFNLDYRKAQQNRWSRCRFPVLLLSQLLFGGFYGTTNVQLRRRSMFDWLSELTREKIAAQLVCCLALTLLQQVKWGRLGRYLATCNWTIHEWKAGRVNPVRKFNCWTKSNN